jgi:IS30 family transposase
MAGRWPNTCNSPSTPASKSTSARNPWQRGTNENTNGLLRKYLAKSADLRQLDQAALDANAAELNGRPRQTLGFKTPS